ncbi:MAG: DNA-directed RNA polymerase [Candidatus Aenigmarchaeota archaeon]|nr:DNA-directed RNA polymerase [Candidatus Aenigmarchaeota archaeon]
MYKIIEVVDDVRVPPSKFEFGLEQSVKASLMDKWEGIIDKSMGVILVVTDVKKIGDGRIFAGDGAVHYDVQFDMLVYRPEQHEIVLGEVIDVTEFGAFMRLGPVDGMVHVSQIMDDFVSYDRKNAIFTGKESKHRLKDGDVMRARIISVSVSGREYKIGLTARQPNLGCLDWIKEDKEKGRKRSSSKRD